MSPYVEWLRRQREIGSARASDEALDILVSAGKISAEEMAYIKGGVT